MPTFSDILVPVDFSDQSDEVLRFGLIMAEPDGATLHLMHDIELPSDTITGATIIKERMDDAYAESERKIKYLEQIPEATGATIRSAVLRSTDPKRSILTYADENDVDLIVLGTHGQTNAVEKMIGSTAERVLRRSPAPSIVVAPGSSRDRLDSILVPVDFSEHSAHAVDHAAGLARAHRARLILLHAESDDPAEDIEAQLRRLYAESGDDVVEASFIAASEDVDEAVSNTAREHRADLILMVTHGRTGLRRAVTPNVAESVIRRAPCPVMTYRTALEE